MKHIPRKRFGQHFLSDQGIIDGIVQAIAPLPGQPMVEIGPGLAALTQPLVERLGRLTVIELDRDLTLRLRLHGQLDVIESDMSGRLLFIGKRLAFIFGKIFQVMLFKPFSGCRLAFVDEFVFFSNGIRKHLLDMLLSFLKVFEIFRGQKRSRSFGHLCPCKGGIHPIVIASR